jgi:O-antigen/teichoic acid export membrane protein
VGLVLRQSVKNSLVILFGYAIGGINTLFLYTHFLQDDYYGLVVFLLSTAYLLMPLITFGIHYAVLRFYSGYKTEKERSAFLLFSLLIPLCIIFPLTAFFLSFYEGVVSWISKDHVLIKDHVWLLLLLAIFAGYFEIFYAWTKVQLKSVFGNFIKELFARVCVFVLLFAVYFELLNSQQFIYAIVVVYGLRTLVMLWYALNLYRPSLEFKVPNNMQEVLLFSLFIIASGTSGSILLEIDKFMIPRHLDIEEVAYYTVGVFIASVVSIPGKAMQQISTAVTAKQLSKGDFQEITKLYQKSSVNLVVVGGLILLLINLNIHDLYEIINKPAYRIGIPIVLMISIAKLSELLLGTGNDIIQNSKYYRIYFYFSLTMALAVILLNHWLIPKIGIHGAALSTLVVMVSFNILKILFIYNKFKMSLFGMQTFKALLTIISIYSIFSFWEFRMNSYLNILLKSILLMLCYFYSIKFLKNYRST